jgi:hypothetical protein
MCATYVGVIAGNIIISHVNTTGGWKSLLVPVPHMLVDIRLQTRVLPLRDGGNIVLLRHAEECVAVLVWFDVADAHEC